MIHPDVFRSLFAYHRALNQKLWDSILTLTDEQFVQPVGYSVGSVRNQVVHRINMDERWFAGLRGLVVPGFAIPEVYPDRARVHAYEERVTGEMQAYLADLTETAISAPRDDLGGAEVWRILLHVANHGTDHCAQLLRLLHDLGAPTTAQDYILWHWGRI